MFLPFATGGSPRSQTTKSSYWWRGKYKTSWFWISKSCIDPSQSLYTWSYYHVVQTTWNFTRPKGRSHTVWCYYYVTEIKLVLEIFHASRYMVIGLNIFWNDDKQSTIPRRFRNWSDFQNIPRTRNTHIRNLARCWGAARLQRRFSSFQTSRTSQKGLFSNIFLRQVQLIQITWFKSHDSYESVSKTWSRLINSNPKAELTNDSINLLQECLHYDPVNRISARKALEHPYFNS